MRKFHFAVAAIRFNPKIDPTAVCQFRISKVKELLPKPSAFPLCDCAFTCFESVAVVLSSSRLRILKFVSVF